MHLHRLSCFRRVDNAGHAMVDFPAIDGTKPSVVHGTDVQLTPTPYLPFRRISLPSAPNLAQRQSIVSIASFDSIPEGPQPVALSIPLNKSPSKGPNRPSSSQDPTKRVNRRRDVKSIVVVDEQREAKRRKVIHELYETERTYVDGLELIYSVCVLRVLLTLQHLFPSRSIS
jgi:FYVE, RhoGEF and PH domain containing 5/6